MRKLTAAAAVSLGTVEPPAPWARPSETGRSQDNGCLPTAGLAVRLPTARSSHDLRCTDYPELFFAESPDEVEAAKALCGGCPVRAACLAGALKRREPWGVWGGEVFLDGAIVPRKRPRGRPRKTDAAARDLGVGGNESPSSPIGLQAFVPGLDSKAQYLTAALADGRLRTVQGFARED